MFSLLNPTCPKQILKTCFKIKKVWNCALRKLCIKLKAQRMIRLGKWSCPVGNLFHKLQRADMQRDKRTDRWVISARDAVFSVMGGFETVLSRSGDERLSWATVGKTWRTEGVSGENRNQASDNWSTFDQCRLVMQFSCSLKSCSKWCCTFIPKG